MIIVSLIILFGSMSIASSPSDNIDGIPIREAQFGRVTFPLNCSSSQWTVVYPGSEGKVRTITSGNSSRFIVEDGSLHIDHVRITDSGKYTCGSTSQYLHVQSSEPYAWATPVDTTAKVTEDVTLTCRVDGIEKRSDVNWYFNGDIITMGRDRVKWAAPTESANYDLLIQSAECSDSGRYTCSPAKLDAAAAALTINQQDKTIATECPAKFKFDSKSNSCFKYLKPIMSFMTAERVCRGYGGHLTYSVGRVGNSFSSGQDKFPAIFSNGTTLIPWFRTMSSPMWFGLDKLMDVNFLDNARRHQWVWSDGPLLENKFDADTVYKPTYHRCAYFNKRGPNHFEVGTTGCWRHFDAICEVSLDSPIITSEKACGSRYWTNFQKDGLCYKAVSFLKKTIIDLAYATRYCQSKGGDIAMPRGRVELRNVYMMYGSEHWGTTRLLIGIIIIGGRAEYMDGTAVDKNTYEFIKKEKSKPCVVITAGDTDADKGLASHKCEDWMNIICQKKQKCGQKMEEQQCSPLCDSQERECCRVSHHRYINTTTADLDCDTHSGRGIHVVSASCGGKNKTEELGKSCNMKPGCRKASLCVHDGTRITVLEYKYICAKDMNCGRNSGKKINVTTATCKGTDVKDKLKRRCNGKVECNFGSLCRAERVLKYTCDEGVKYIGQMEDLIEDYQTIDDDSTDSVQANVLLLVTCQVVLFFGR